MYNCKLFEMLLSIFEKHINTNFYGMELILHAIFVEQKVKDENLMQ